MKLEQARITILINQDSTEIVIEDRNSNTEFVKVVLTPEQLNSCLSRLGKVECEVELFGLDKIGKKHENKSFEFEIPEDLKGKESLELLCNEALKAQQMEEWKSDGI